MEEWGLVVMWKESVKMEGLQVNRRLMDFKVKWKNNNFFLTCLYGEPVRSNRSEVWERLSRIV